MGSKREDQMPPSIDGTVVETTNGVEEMKGDEKLEG
jgi:hypothetical protein